MSPQISNVERFSPTPIRQYARDAVAAVHDDQQRGVLLWRIATYLLSQHLFAAVQPPKDLAQVSVRERDRYLGLAAAVIALSESIATSAPPTPGEIARYEQRKLVALARARATHNAARLGHELEPFRASEPGYQLALCRGCGAGVSIHLESAGVSAAAVLEQQCSVTR